MISDVSPMAKTYPGNTWIVTAYRFARHGNIKTAQMEHARLSVAHPNRTFEILRVKNTLEPSDSAGRIRTLERLVEQLIVFLTDEGDGGFTGEGLDILRRRCSDALPDDKCPDWLKRYRRVKEAA